jgi:hypothetical protein
MRTRRATQQAIEFLGGVMTTGVLVLGRRAFNIVFVIACGLLMARFFLPASHASSPLNYRLRTGDTFAYHTRSHRRAPTLYVYIMPAYSSDRLFRIIEGLRTELPGGLLVVLARDPEAAKTALQDHQVTVDEVAPVNASEVGIRAAPTFLVVDRRGAVQGIWRGLPDDSSQQSILDALRAATGNGL